MTPKKLLILNGPGLADPGPRDGGSSNPSLGKIQDDCSALCEQLGIDLEFHQTDDEVELVSWIAKTTKDFDALIINPVGRSRAASAGPEMYRSVSKSIAALDIPVIEVHIANIFKDDAVMTKPLQVPDTKLGFVCGMGRHGYLLAIKALEQRLNDQRQKQ